MEFLTRLITDYGLSVVFFNIFLEQLGAPLPGYPVLLVTGALAARGQIDIFALLGTAVFACLVADTAWYVAGLWFGRKVLRLLCRVSLSPDGCVRQTESIFARYGAPSLVVAKFVPGFASVATALAGSLGIPRSRFLFFDVLGAALWVGVALTLGWLFSPAIEQIVATLGQIGKWGAVLLVVALLLFVASKWWQRWRFNRQLRMERITVESLAALIDSDRSPVILDVRSEIASGEGRIPGALTLGPNHAFPQALLDAARDLRVVVYCACPNDASAVLMARKLAQMGFTDVWPLRGGIEAWSLAGRALQQR